MPPPVDVTYDMRNATPWSLVGDAFACIFAPPGRVLRVLGRPAFDAGQDIEITLHEGPLRDAMMAYGMRVLALSLVISLVTAALIFLSVRRFLVRPMARFIAAMRGFQDDPENPAKVIRLESGVAEIAGAEAALADLQTELRAALRQKDRLAGLGEAVAKISHDLRNILTTAQLLADRVAAIDDARLARTAPKLIASLDRAVRLCDSTLNFGRAEEPAPVVRRVRARTLIEEARDAVFPDGESVARKLPSLVSMKSSP